MSSLFEDKLDIVEEDDDMRYPAIGECFASLAEEHEFDVYTEYVTNLPTALATLERVLKPAEARRQLAAVFGEQGALYFKAARFELPKLLLVPLYHINHYFELVDVLAQKCPSSELADRQYFWQAASHFKGMKAAVDVDAVSARLTDAGQHVAADTVVKRPTYLKFSQPLAFEQRVHQTKVRAAIGDNDGTVITGMCGKLVRDTTLRVWNEKVKRPTERRLFLFENMLACCKVVSGRGGKQQECKVKEMFRTRRYTVEPLPDVPAAGHALRVGTAGSDGGGSGGGGSSSSSSSTGVKVVLMLDSAEQRDAWAALLKSNEVNRFLTDVVDAKQKQEAKELPSLLPDARLYVFATPDEASNIIFDEAKVKLGLPVVKGGTLHKLVERLTFPQYADLSYLRQFFSTYKSFCTPDVLLDCLIARYRVPLPHWLVKPLAKKYNRTFAIPIKVRIVNVLKHWV